MATVAGIEPAASCVTGRRSDHLNYTADWGPRASPTQWVAWGKEEQRHECALAFESQSKRYRACSDVVTPAGFEPGIAALKGR